MPSTSKAEIQQRQVDRFGARKAIYHWGVGGKNSCIPWGYMLYVM